MIINRRRVKRLLDVVVPKTATVNEDTTLNDTHHTVLVDASADEVVIALPPAASAVGRVYHVKKVDPSANGVKVDGNAVETIDGKAMLVLIEQFQAITVQSNGSAWSVL
jgi:hypothetical protein